MDTPTPKQLTEAILVIRDHLILTNSDHEDAMIRAFESAGLMRECEGCRAAWAYPDDPITKPCENCGHVAPGRTEPEKDTRWRGPIFGMIVRYSPVFKAWVTEEPAKYGSITTVLPSFQDVPEKFFPLTPIS